MNFITLDFSSKKKQKENVMNQEYLLMGLALFCAIAAIDLAIAQ